MGEARADRIPVGEEIILTGVATDFCILATALGASDAGRYVTVVEDACSGSRRPV
ncbi:isochorismatase family protein [Arthrobacter sp. FW306-2-2C-D06B]|uniref:isochorismatase family protein n=1 Tax=Arthrobacter sp. FW306-2-2C-D06B TaxID=2879618 RepID=UPI001F3EEB74|nr:isochorismatase family protein [Arthrobacter sp. FW306-2-2C-D06B]UKA60629.1 isochorismatase family protein [Arthrobacter sp. FW306-2-2C-D06B]